MRTWTLLTAATFAFATTAHAQGASDTTIAASFARLTHAARGRLATDNGRLWRARLDTLPWLGVAGPVAYLSRDPKLEGYTRIAEGVWSGPPPRGIAPSNTSIDWAGRRWAMFLLPLPDDSLDAVRLLIHEATHVLQPTVLPTPKYSETGNGTDLLDRDDGRTWLRLEWRALEAALDAMGAERASATRDALLFRARRYVVATNEERTRERALDVSEGIPEFSGWHLTGGTAAEFARSMRAHAEKVPSYVRAFPYYTGPAYAMLLEDTRGAAWRHGLDSRADLSRSLAAAMTDVPAAVTAALAGDVQSRDAVRALADAAGTRYGLDAVASEERARQVEREQRVAELTARFVEGPTIRLRPRSLRIAFDPNRQTSLGGEGTVMGGFVWHGEDGAELVADDGALVASDWSEVRVPLDGARIAAGPLAERLQLTGNGWRLVLPAGWTVEAASGGSVVLRLAPK